MLTRLLVLGAIASSAVTSVSAEPMYLPNIPITVHEEKPQVLFEGTIKDTCHVKVTEQPTTVTLEGVCNITSAHIP